MNKMIFPLSLAAVVTLIDQLTKWIVKTRMVLDGPSIPLIGSFLQFTYIENPGMAFGIHVGNAKWFFTGLSILVSVGVFIYLSRAESHHRWLRIALSLVLGGAVGNLIDRVLYGRVVDFIHASYKSYYFPIFNVADSAVSIGMAILILLVLFEKETPEPVYRQNSQTPVEHPASHSKM